MNNRSALVIVSELVDETAMEWNLDLDEPANGKTRLSEDLCFSSVEMLHLLAAIDMKLSTKLPWERLIRIGNAYRTELTIDELAVFIEEHRGAPLPGIRSA